MEVFVLVNAVNVPRLVHYSMSFYDNLYGLVCEEYDRRSRVVRSRLVIVRLDDDILLSNTIHRNHSCIVFFSLSFPPSVFLSSSYEILVLLLLSYGIICLQYCCLYNSYVCLVVTERALDVRRKVTILLAFCCWFGGMPILRRLLRRMRLRSSMLQGLAII